MKARRRPVQLACRILFDCPEIVRVLRLNLTYHLLNGNFPPFLLVAHDSFARGVFTMFARLPFARDPSVADIVVFPLPYIWSNKKRDVTMGLVSTDVTLCFKQQCLDQHTVEEELFGSAGSLKDSHLT